MGREAVKEVNKRLKEAEMLIESDNRRNRERCTLFENERETDEGEVDVDIGVVNDWEDEQERNGNETNRESDHAIGDDVDLVHDSDPSGPSDLSDQDQGNLTSSGSDDEEQILDPGKYVREELLEWALLGGISMAKVDDLLIKLKPVLQNLPLSYKTLLKTPRKIELVDCGNGFMWYYGIKPQLHHILTREYLSKHNEITTDINIDSVPLFNKSSANFVPILGRLVGHKHPFIIGIFCGKGSDPKDLDTFLESYVAEVNDLKSNGFIFEEERHKFKTRHYILDQKARATIKCVKGVRGYFCCEKCTVRGTDYMRRMCLLNHDCVLRTDESFIDLVIALMMPKTQHFDDNEIDSHVNGVSPLLGCETKLVSKFRLDSMHLVYKGVFSRWMEFLWSPGFGNYSLSTRKKQEISALLGSLRKWCPKDFNRRPYAIKSEKLKATELRRILLYDGLVAFKNLDKNIFKNFLLLHVAIYILCSPVLYQVLNEEANGFLRVFVTHSQSLFGKEFIVYNVHSLVHLSSECLDHGPLDSFGAFLFENFLGMIKSRVTSKTKPLQQIAKREMERINKRKETLKPAPPLLQMPCINNPNEQLTGQQYGKILVKESVLSPKLADSCCTLHDGSVVHISNIIDSEDGPVLVGKKYEETSDYYEYPIASSLLGIFKVSQLQERSFYFTPDDVKYKCYLLPLKENEYVSVPLLHSY